MINIDFAGAIQISPSLWCFIPTCFVFLLSVEGKFNKRF